MDNYTKASVEPSLVQMVMFLDSAEVGLAFLEPGWLMRPLSWGLGVAMGRWGGWLLGYRSSYEEYYDGKIKRT
jgi:hypothetical protein